MKDRLVEKARDIFCGDGFGCVFNDNAFWSSNGYGVECVGLIRMSIVLVVMGLLVKIREPKRSCISAGTSPSLSATTYLFTDLSMRPHNAVKQVHRCSGRIYLFNRNDGAFWGLQVL